MMDAVLSQVVADRGRRESALTLARPLGVDYTISRVIQLVLSQARPKKSSITRAIVASLTQDLLRKLDSLRRRVVLRIFTKFWARDGVGRGSPSARIQHV